MPIAQLAYPADSTRQPRGWRKASPPASRLVSPYGTKAYDVTTEPLPCLRMRPAFACRTTRTLRHRELRGSRLTDRNATRSRRGAKYIRTFGRCDPSPANTKKGARREGFATHALNLPLSNPGFDAQPGMRDATHAARGHRCLRPGRLRGASGGSVNRCRKESILPA